MNKLTAIICASVLPLAANVPNAWAQNPVRTVAQVTSAVTLDEAVDYTVTGTTPFATAGSIDIANADAAVIFQNIKPSEVISKYLRYVTSNGSTLTNNTNCRVSIYRHGSIVLPHSDTKNADGTDFYPLTVYLGDNFTGDSYQYNGGSRQTAGPWVDAMRSFKLKRGYMLTVANMSDGTGYSHCYIANSKDIEVQLRKELASKVGFFRIFRWQWPAKKGSCDVAPDKLNASWHYNWGAGSSSGTDYEYVPQRHHEAGNSNSQGWKGAWSSWGTINAADATCTHILGQNEPDNTSGAGEVYTYVSKIPDNPRTNCATSTLTDHAAEFLYSGMRIGTFACCNPSTGWVTEYVNWCRENNIRVDFVATHFYIGGQSPAGCISRLKALYTATGLPVWATEWNNGANWTSESGFSTDAGWYSWGSGNDSQKNGTWLTDVLRRADSEPWLERLAVYNAVQAKREVVTNGSLTDGGKLYADFKSGFAYNEQNEYFMSWRHKGPTDLKVLYTDKTRRAILQWTNQNGKQTDSTYVERKVEGEADWTVIGKKGLASSSEQTFNADTLTDVSGLVTYRIHTFDSDGRQRYSGEAYVSIGQSKGNSDLQFGAITLTDASQSVRVDFTHPYTYVDESGKEVDKGKPAVFMGLISSNNATTTTTPMLKYANITTKYFNYLGKTWAYQPDATESYEAMETIPYMTMPYGHYTYGDMDVEVGSIALRDTTEVKFEHPFPDGVTPVVIATVNNAPISSRAITHKVWDVTNTGFRCTVNYELGSNSRVVANQTVAYMAVTPGHACVDGSQNIHIAAGFGSNPVYRIAKAAYFAVGKDAETSDTLKLVDPYIFGEFQTANIDVPTTLRKMTTIKASILNEDGQLEGRTTGFRVRRILDESGEASITETLQTADTLGWVVVHQTPDYAPVGIDKPQVFTSENPLNVEVINRIVYVDGYKDFELYTINGIRAAANATQEPGIYIVRAGGKIAKILVK